jgi:hypothetical protein
VRRYLPFHRKIHLVGLAAISWAIRRTRNSICFDKKNIKSPAEIICMSSSFLMFWAGLQKPEDKANLEAGAVDMKESALWVHVQSALPEGTRVVMLQKKEEAKIGSYRCCIVK